MRKSSASSIYDDATEDDERMEFEEERETRLRKRRLSGRGDGGEESREDAPKQRRGNDKERSASCERREMERIEKELRRKRSEERKRNEAEKEKRLAKEQRKQEKEEERKMLKEREVRTAGQNIDKVQKSLWTIMTAIERETAGKISFTRGDQTAVRLAVYEIQNEMIGLMTRLMESEEKTHRLEEEKRDQRRQVDGNRRDRGVMQKTSESEEWQVPKLRRRPTVVPGWKKVQKSTINCLCKNYDFLVVY